MRPATLTTLLALCLALPGLAGHANAAPRVAPAAHCLDARQTSGLYQSDDTTVAVASGKRHYLLTLASSCPGLGQDAGLTLRAPGGWICGRDNESVVSATARCPIAGVAEVDSRLYARHARQATRARATATGMTDGSGNTLETVEVTATAGINRRERFARGFVGTADYCFNPAQMRSWTETVNGLQVEVSPRRNAGNRTYAVELSGSCPMLSGNPGVLFRSGMGLGVICGNPGDRLVAIRDTFSGEPSPAWRNIGSQAVEQSSPGITTVASGQCLITAVYPVHS